jgi:hypothetical protein
MHLSKELQKQLDKINSTVRLSTTIDGILPNKYAFLRSDNGRNFRINFANSENEFSTIFYERTNQLKYENCFGRAIFDDLAKLASAIDLWIDKNLSIDFLKEQFPEIETFEPFDFRHDNSDIEAAWIKVQNMFFNDEFFWKDKEWRHRYHQMLLEAKKKKDFHNYFPFTSHYWLRFSIDKDITETWPLGLHIMPTIDTSKGQYYVGVSDENKDGYFFDNIADALNFYSKKLNETKPTKWLDTKAIR